MAEINYCNTWTGNKKFQIEQISDYPFKVNEIKINTFGGTNSNNLIKRSLLEIYIQNADGTRILSKNITMLATNFVWEINKELCSNQKLVIKSSNKIRRNYTISVSGCELIPDSESNFNANLQINDIDVSEDNPVNVIEKRFKGTGNFTRPANAIAYTALDAITDSITEPHYVDIDLSDYVEEGDTIYITNINISASSKLTGAQINV